MQKHTPTDFKKEVTDLQNEIEAHRTAFSESLSELEDLGGAKEAIDAMRSNLVTITRRSEKMLQMVTGLIESHGKLMQTVHELNNKLQAVASVPHASRANF